MFNVNILGIRAWIITEYLYFIRLQEEEDSNEGNAKVVRNLENGLLFPEIYLLRARNKNRYDVRNKELQAIKEKVK